MSTFPTPFEVSLLTTSEGPEDAHGNPTIEWVEELRDVIGWGPPRGREPKTAGVSALVVDLELFVDETWRSKESDLVVVDGEQYEQIGVVEDYNHGPFGWMPGSVVNLSRSK
jgi:hypothetical protein